MTRNETPNQETWEDFQGKFIKAEMIKKFPALFIPTSLKTYYDDEENARLTYTGEIEGKKKDFEPNKTNIEIIRNSGITSPSKLLGRKVFFKSVMNFNPQLKKKVPSIEIERIE